MAEGKWVQIDPERELFPGDVVRLHYKTVGPTYVTAAQIAAIENRIEKDKRFTMLRHSIPVKESPAHVTDFFVDVKVVSGVYVTHFAAAAAVTGAVINTVIIAAVASVVFGAVVSISFYFMEKFVKTYGETGEVIEETVKTAGTSSLQVAAAIIGILAALKWLR